MVAEGTPIPTPWDQERYDATSIAFQKRRRALRAQGASEAEMDAYFAEVKAVTGPMLAGEPYAGKVGAFEGAGYRAHGLYRPATDCIMFTRNPQYLLPGVRSRHRAGHRDVHEVGAPASAQRHDPASDGVSVPGSRPKTARSGRYARGSIMRVVAAGGSKARCVRMCCGG